MRSETHKQLHHKKTALTDIYIYCW